MKKEINVEFIAKMCHEANRQLCMDNGDNSYNEWENTPDWQKEPMINGVKHLLDNPGLTAEGMFNNWKSEKINSGWVYGPIKNPETKEHPCLVEYADLPAFEKAKDVVIINMVNTLKDLF